MAKSVVLESITFKTQASAHKFFQDMLNRYNKGDRVNQEDEVFLHQLLKRHLDYVTKVGCGIDHFEIMAADFGTQCFGVVRTDFTEENFSFNRCITRIP